jgi:hypothetical protein
LKSGSNHCLSFSKPVYNAIIQTGWKLNQNIWKDYPIKEARGNLSNELEIVRILIRKNATLQDCQTLMNLDYGHKLHAIPLFVFNIHQLKLSEMIDFAVGFTTGDKIECYKYDLITAKVIKVELKDLMYLVEKFEELLYSGSLKTVDQFIEESKPLR